MGNNVLIFGAGASYGSDNGNVPPLGADLYDALMRFNPDGWGNLPDNIAATFQLDFEEGIRTLSSSHALPPLQRAMAAYFFNYLPSPNNLYKVLAERIKHANWRGSLVTLNYERLLEISLSSEGLRPVVGREGNNSDKIELCLPHGCCHLFCESVRGTASGVSFSGANIQTNGPISVIADPNDFRNRIQTDAFPPVMSYFEPQKRTTSGSNFIDSQRRRYEELIAEADVIGVVGIKVRPHDEHIWGPMERTSGKIVYSSGATSGKLFKNWADEKRPEKEQEILNGYFNNCFNDICTLVGIV